MINMLVNLLTFWIVEFLHNVKINEDILQSTCHLIHEWSTCLWIFCLFSHGAECHKLDVHCPSRYCMLKGFDTIMTIDMKIETLFDVLDAQEYKQMTSIDWSDEINSLEDTSSCLFILMTIVVRILDITKMSCKVPLLSQQTNKMCVCINSNKEYLICTLNASLSCCLFLLGWIKLDWVCLNRMQLLRSSCDWIKDCNLNRPDEQQEGHFQVYHNVWQLWMTFVQKHTWDECSCHYLTIYFFLVMNPLHQNLKCSKDKCKFFYN